MNPYLEFTLGILLGPILLALIYGVSFWRGNNFQQLSWSNTKDKMKTETQSVESEVMEAYCDCHGKLTLEEAMPRRNLNFKESLPLTRDEAVKLMAKATPGGYNEFDADKLKLLPKDSMVTIAREGSPAVYVSPAIKKPIKAMKADEWNSSGNVTRIWWD